MFFTNYGSRKGIELAASPACALLFGWYPVERQVRVDGEASGAAARRGRAYFATRPRGAQLGAWASRQSERCSVGELHEAYAAADARFAGEQVPAPPLWGGYRVRPAASSSGRAGRAGCTTDWRTDAARRTRPSGTADASLPDASGERENPLAGGAGRPSLGGTRERRWSER